ncbi:glucans biosynthesis glucosyltransferase MdoH [Bradyrhizobium sp.]|uniref:glucans biosynthesis glucosyltransferase MdoH n=1 Tax=Bradyrhizobium sp. TaxID=376 RepID=UPI00273286F0|nr:glucans biosynthesis glucosyltransferase MdoH [Bradyrhizobium sp.]MDP3077771.1 glucans biosynthesis glucosyltransferase MdoH [Bradyrhizobium sp.]
MDALTSSTLERRPGSSEQVAFLPPESALEMSTRALRNFERGSGAADFTPNSLTLRRSYIFTGTAALTLGGCYEMYQVLQVGGITTLEAMVLVLFALLFAWIAFSFTSSLAGFFVLLFRQGDALGIDSDSSLPQLRSRNAMLLPTYNEDPYRVMARLRAIHESVGETGSASQFDWYVLSDTTDPSLWIAEEKCFMQLRREAGTGLFYRHRPANTARKSGNIEDWVKRFGGGYDHMIILDADSLMTGDTIVRLAAAMESHPNVALIQTLPIVVNARTLFARLQQFAGRLYGPLIAAGIAWWHGSEGNYWGHNAIIRVRAFAQDAGLPELRGRKPFGGHILSHDFVEAALMRRAGWAIHMAPMLGGSFEECPPSLLDFAARDRRWCQGNLQHLAVLPARGLHWVSRLHLLTGIGSYLTAPLWLIFLALGILISLQAQFVRPEYFSKGSLFPQWPAQDPVLAAWVFLGTMGLLIVPKLLAFLLLLTQRETRKRFGGGFVALVGILIETLLSSLIAPVMMIFQSTAVGEILLGRDAGWQVQRRDDGGVPRSETVRRYALPTLVGIVMAIAGYAVSLPLLLWMTPVIIGLLLAIPIALLSSGSSGGAGRPPRLFATPEQTSPPQVLVRANQLATAAPTAIGCPVLELRNDTGLLDAHVNNLPASKRIRGQVNPHLAIARAKIEDAESLEEALRFLNTHQTFAALNSAPLLQALLELPISADGTGSRLKPAF